MQFVAGISEISQISTFDDPVIVWTGSKAGTVWGGILEIDIFPTDSDRVAKVIVQKCRNFCLDNVLRIFSFHLNSPFCYISFANFLHFFSPKLVALPGGEMNEPWPWAPDTFSLQLLQLGSFDVASLPGEFTTMAGRRVRNAIFNVTGHEVVLAGLANIYINYVTTPEEYDVQEYEGGATLYGRNTVPVTTAIYTEMAEALQNVRNFATFFCKIDKRSVIFWQI